jgi:uncharacterized protein
VILCDVNVLVYAFREDAERHEEFGDWLTDRAAGDEAVGVSDQVLGSFVRIVTNRRVFARPSRLERALEFAEALRNLHNGMPVRPGPRHFSRLCREGKATGNLVPDAYFAALAIENGCEWITTDRDYARFPGLRWRHPLEG